MEEISTIISYHEDKRSQNLLQVVVRIIMCQNGKMHSTKLNVVSNQISELFFFASVKS